MYACIVYAIYKMHDYDACFLYIDDARTNTSVSVLNACRLKTPDGQLDTIKGYATRPNDKEQGKLEVVFNGVTLGRTNCEQNITNILILLPVTPSTILP